MLRASSSWGQVEGNTVEYNPGLKIVLKAKVNVNNRDVDDKTPLMRVVEHSNIQFARILVSPVVHSPVVSDIRETSYRCDVNAWFLAGGTWS